MLNRRCLKSVAVAGLLSATWALPVLAAEDGKAAPTPVQATVQDDQAAVPESGEMTGPAPDEFAVQVDGNGVQFSVFESAMTQAMREKFYHGKAPEGQVAELRLEVAREMADTMLLLREARRLGMQAPVEEVDKRLNEIDAANRGNEQWEARREQFLPRLRNQMLDNLRVRELERQIRTVEEPTEEKLRAYYEANPSYFTEPMRERVGVILLGVEPSAPAQTWQAAKEEAEKLAAKLEEGADFAALAKLHSSDGSAADGGDMGYLHRGMLAKPAQEAVDELAVGETSGAVELLQGYAVFRLLDRKEPVLRPFEEVRGRAADLYKRDAAEESWNNLLERLRNNAEIVFHPTLLAAADGSGAPEGADGASAPAQ